jgi:rod shape-determining protein MreC
MMFKRPHYIALFIVVLFVAILSRIPNPALGNIKLAIGGMFLPLFGLAGTSHDLVQKAAKAALPRSVLVEQNESLRQTNEAMAIQLQQYQEVWRENERLRRLVNWQKQNRWNLKLAHVITRDPANWWRSAQIDAGSVDGIRVNQPVICGEGLIGRVQSVSERRSQVILLGDPELKVAAVIDGTRETGIIQTTSSSPEENNMVDLGFLQGNSDIRPGQDVRTSGDGGIFPAGLPIGKIVDSRSKDYGLSKEARVKLSASIGSLEEVWVVIQ